MAQTGPVFIPILPKRKVFTVEGPKISRELGRLGFKIVQKASTYPTAKTPYRRTGTLGKGWTKRGPFRKGQDILVLIGNIVKYTRYVMGLKKGKFSQRKLFKALGWTGIEEIAEQELKKSSRRLRDAIQGK